jgi:hypothetical protein
MKLLVRLLVVLGAVASLGMASAEHASGWGESAASPAKWGDTSSGCNLVKVRQRNSNGTNGPWSSGYAGYIFAGFSGTAIGGSHYAQNTADTWLGGNT